MTFCWHKWSKWEVIQKGPLYSDIGPRSDNPVGNYEMQRRVCEKCGKSQLRRTESA